MRLGGMLRRHMFLYALRVPLTAISDGMRVVSPVESENGVESRTDGLGSG